MSTYSEKLKDPRWQKKRLEILERDKWTCQRCHDTKSTLHVHHRRYLPQKEPWDYPNKMFCTLCEECHKHEKTAMAEYTDTLIEVLKEKFLADDIFDLVEGFLHLKIEHNSGDFSSMLKELLWDESLMTTFTEEHLNIKKKRHAKQSN